MELKAEKYKQTEVGLIPSDWEVKSIGSFTDVCAGGTPSTFVREFWNGNIRWMNSGELNLKYVFEVENRITELGLNNSATRLIPVNCILIGLAGQGKTRGTVAINKVELCTNQSIAAIFPCEKVDYNFLYFNLDSRYSELRGLSTGDGGRGGLNLTIIKNLQISLPPNKTEQTAIATALSDADALINSLEKLIAKKRNIKQGAMQQLLKPNPDNNREGWELKKLGEIFTFYSTANYSKAEMTLDGEIGCLHYGLVHAIANVIYSLKDGVTFYLKEDVTSYEFIQDGDIVMVDASEDFLGINKSIELSNVSNRKFIAGLHTYLMRDTNNILVNNFRGLILNSSSIKQQMLKLAVGMKVYGVSKTQLLEVQIPVPPKQEQTRIATILSDMDAEIQALETKLEKYRKIKLGMMQNLLTGKIRLI